MFLRSFILKTFALIIISDVNKETINLHIPRSILLFQKSEIHLWKWFSDQYRLIFKTSKIRILKKR